MIPNQLLLWVKIIDDVLNILFIRPGVYGGIFVPLFQTQHSLFVCSRNYFALETAKCTWNSKKRANKSNFSSCAMKYKCATKTCHHHILGYFTKIVNSAKLAPCNDVVGFNIRIILDYIRILESLNVTFTIDVPQTKTN